MKTALSDALAKRGYTQLTPVQEAVLNPDVTGADMLVSAQTGSGKTLGFGLAIAPSLLQEAEQFGRAGAPLALVIAPTRELALQVKRELSWLYEFAGAQMASTVGGMDMRTERRNLERGAHMVVATPGRLRDHIMRGTIDLSQLRAVVLDEADEMLDLGFREDLEFILGEAPESRQTLLFSATVSKPIAQLATRYQKDAVRIVAKSEATQHADIDYKAMMVAERDGENAVINTLRFHESPNAIVFANTRAMVNRLTTRLSNRGFQVVALSGELSQTERTHALQAMRDGRAQVCVATDVAARGIDLPNLDLVVHAELPNSHETLLHRSGRTGRAGRKGVSALVVTKKVRRKAERILKMAKLTAEWTTAPTADAIRERDEGRMLADPEWHTPVQDNEQDVVQTLQAQFSAEQLATAYLRLYRSMRSAPEELADVDAAPAPRAEFGASVWFSIAGGRAAGAEPRRLLPMICKAGNVSRDDIGAIRIQGDQSYVQILQKSVPAFLEAVGSGMNIEGAALVQLAEAPNLGPSGPRGKPERSGGKPRFDKPRDKKPRSAAPKDHKPRAEKAPGETGPKPKYEKPARGKSAGFDPATSAKPSESKPIDWNDDPKPRVKKPKPGTKPKPHRKTGKGAPAPRGGEDTPRRRRDHEGAVSEAGPSKRSKPKGPPPPKGKPSSKKNRARIAATKAAKGGGKKGGSAGLKGPRTSG